MANRFLLAGAVGALLVPSISYAQSSERCGCWSGDGRRRWGCHWGASGCGPWRCRRRYRGWSRRPEGAGASAVLRGCADRSCACELSSRSSAPRCQEISPHRGQRYSRSRRPEDLQDRASHSLMDSPVGRFIAAGGCVGFDELDAAPWSRAQGRANGAGCGCEAQRGGQVVVVENRMEAGIAVGACG